LFSDPQMSRLKPRPTKIIYEVNLFKSLDLRKDSENEIVGREGQNRDAHLNCRAMEVNSLLDRIVFSFGLSGDFCFLEITAGKHSRKATDCPSLHSR